MDWQERWGKHPIVWVQQSHNDWITGPPMWWDDKACVFVTKAEDGVGLYVFGIGPANEVALLLENFESAGFDPNNILRFSVPCGTNSNLVPRLTGAWEWMHATRVFDNPDNEYDVEELFDVGELTEALARCHPNGELIPGTEKSRWWGWRSPDGLIRSLGGVSLPFEPGAPWMLGSIGTDPEWRNRGISRAVVSAITEAGLKECPVVCLSLYSKSDAARRVYQNVGYQTTQRNESYRPELV